VSELRIALTRTAQDNRLWAAELEAAGHTPIDVPSLAIEAIHESAPALRRALAAAPHLLFTSARPVHGLMRIAPELSLEGRICSCVGESSAEAARKLGARVELVAPELDATSLAKEWLQTNKDTGTPPLWLRAQEARAELPKAFKIAKRALDSIAVYRTSAAETIDLALLQTADAIFIASPSAARAITLAGASSATARVIAIGPSTAQALEELGWRVHGVADERNLQGMLAALLSNPESTKALIPTSEPIH
jgi:uroporphyrinogen-III synthase